MACHSPPGFSASGGHHRVFHQVLVAGGHSHPAGSREPSSRFSPCPAPSAWTQSLSEGYMVCAAQRPLAAAHLPWPHTLSGLVALTPLPEPPCPGPASWTRLECREDHFIDKETAALAEPVWGEGFSGCGQGQVGAGPWQRRILSRGFWGVQGIGRCLHGDKAVGTGQDGASLCLPPGPHDAQG